MTIKALRQDFDVTQATHETAPALEEGHGLIVRRNDWPSDKNEFKKYNDQKKAFIERYRKTPWRVFNSLNASGDMKGKQYLADLSGQGFPVIPTVRFVDEISNLPRSEKYVIKPLNGYSGIGHHIESYKDVLNRDPQSHIIEPYYDFKQEVSFYFIGKEFLYSLWFTPENSKDRIEPTHFVPDPKELEMAMRFVNWNSMSFGVQRIDFLRLSDGSLQLLEIEDDSPYFSIPNIDKKLREKFLEEMRNSVRRVLSPFSL